MSLFNRKPSTNELGLEAAINAVLASMQAINKETPEYTKMVDHLKELYALKETENNLGTKSRVSPDTMAIVLGNLAGILVIVAYERSHVMVSKGLSFVLKTPVTSIR